MLNFPDINPVIIHVGPLAITWYSLSYVTSILAGWYIAGRLILLAPLGITKQNIDDFITWAIVGVIVGGRLGYVLFYDPTKYFADPIEILMTYHGGMSFHGGLIGFTIAAFLYCKKNKLPFLSFMDLASIVTPIGFFLGRIANFINGELFGRPTSVPWGIIFPHSDGVPRHPSQLYEAFLEGLVLFFIMLYFTYKHKFLEKPGKLSAILLIFYGVFRAVIEFFREPDIQIGFIAGWFTQGQLLCLPMIILGGYLLFIRKTAKESF